MAWSNALPMTSARIRWRITCNRFLNLTFKNIKNLIFKVGGLLGNLKNMALDMGNELDKQNEQVERITNKAEMNFGRIDDANAWANKILNDRWKVELETKNNQNNA